MLMGQIMTRGGVNNLVGAAIGNGCTGTEVGICNFGGPLRAKAVADYCKADTPFARNPASLTP